MKFHINLAGVDCQRAELLVEVLKSAFTPSHPLLCLSCDDIQRSRTVTPQSDQRVSFTGRDVSEIAIGDCVVTFPAATTKEAGILALNGRIIPVAFPAIFAATVEGGLR